MEILFRDKADFLWFCSEERLKGEFAQEALSAWDSLEGRLPRFDVFVKAFTNARWEAFLEASKWN